MFLKAKIKPVRIPTRPTALQQYKMEIGDDELPEATLKTLQQKYGISNAELVFSEKLLIEREDGIKLIRRVPRSQR